MTELTQEELNGLSPRARKAYGQSNDILQEIVEVNPNADHLETVEPEELEEVEQEEIEQEEEEEHEKL